MILQALHALCEREGLMGSDPHYQMKRVPWMVRVGEKGRFLGMVDNRSTLTIPPKSPRGKVRIEKRAKYQWVPREPERTSGDYAFFLCDTTEYVFGVDAPAKKGAKRPKSKLANRHALFMGKLEQCLRATSDPAIQALIEMLKSAPPNSAPGAVDPECDGSDLIAFVYAADVDLLISDRQAVREYWSQVQDQARTELPVATCLVTGNTGPMPEKHPMLKGVPGGTTSGVALVSFNANAFESYKLKDSANAPISVQASLQCSTALNRLLSLSPPDPSNPDSQLPSRSYRLSADTVVCFWAVADSAQDYLNNFAPILEANPEDVRQIYHSIWKGRTPPDLDPAAFYALTLTGTQGRAIVRDWFESTVRDVASNVAQYFADLSMVRRCPPPKKAPNPPSFNMRTLLEAIADPVKRRGEGVSAHLAAEWAHAALGGRLFPQTALSRAVNRYRMEIGKENDDDGWWFAKNWNDHRAAIIRATLLRMMRAGNTHTLKKEIAPTMDPTLQNQGYVLGQLMAIFERLQQLAMDNPNASVVDRYFSGASAAPKSVFVRLYKNARHHARKARDDRKNAGMAFLMERLVDTLSERFGLDPKAADYKTKLAYPHTLGFPAHLSLEEQGLFVLGYHQMRHWLWLGKEDRLAWEAEHPDAPRAYHWSKEKAEAEKQTGENLVEI